MNEPTPLQADKLIEMVDKLPVCSLKGRISQAIGLTLEATGPRLSLGELCYIRTNHGTGQYIPAEVVGFRNNRTLLMPLGELEGIGPGSELVASGIPLRVKVGMELKGRVLSGLGDPIDGQGHCGPLPLTR